MDGITNIYSRTTVDKPLRIQTWCMHTLRINNSWITQTKTKNNDDEFVTEDPHRVCVKGI